MTTDSKPQDTTTALSFKFLTLQQIMSRNESVIAQKRYIIEQANSAITSYLKTILGTEHKELNALTERAKALFETFYEKNRLLAKPATLSGFVGEAERRTAVYIGVHEDLSTTSTPKAASEVEFCKKSNENTPQFIDYSCLNEHLMVAILVANYYVPNRKTHTPFDKILVKIEQDPSWQPQITMGILFETYVNLYLELIIKKNNHRNPSPGQQKKMIEALSEVAIHMDTKDGSLPKDVDKILKTYGLQLSDVCNPPAPLIPIVVYNKQNKIEFLTPNILEFFLTQYMFAEVDNAPISEKSSNSNDNFQERQEENILSDQDATQEHLDEIDAQQSSSSRTRRGLGIGLGFLIFGAGVTTGIGLPLGFVKQAEKTHAWFNNHGLGPVIDTLSTSLAAQILVSLAIAVILAVACCAVCQLISTPVTGQALPKNGTNDQLLGEFGAKNG